MEYIALTVALLGVMAGMRAMRARGRCSRLADEARQAAAILRNGEVCAAEKELAAQRSAAVLFGEGIALLGRLLLALVGPALFLLLCLELNLFTPEELSAALTDIDFVVVSSLLLVAGWRVYA